MQEGYFQRISRETPTRLWINNPSAEETEKAIDQGAVGCTTNPQFCQKLLQSEPRYVKGLIDEVIRDVDDDKVAAERVYQTAAQRIMRMFLPLYEQSGGAYGYVTIQGDPRRDSDPAAIVSESLRFRDLGENYMAKVPVTLAGVAAIEELVTEGVPVCATEVFSVSQAVHCCEAYERAASRSGRDVPFYVTHITGILDDYWRAIVESERIPISADAISQAGCTVAREEYRLIRERGYKATMMGGGARGTHHFTEMVGADMCVTLNWSTVKELIDKDAAVSSRIGAFVSDELREEMTRSLPGFARAFLEGRLAIEEAAEFGPLVLFRGSFLNGYARLIDEIADRRQCEPGRGARLE